MRLRLDHIFEAARTIAPEFLHSPQFLCEPLSDELGSPVVLKCETQNPIRSFKGRGADFFLQKLDKGVAEGGLVCASAGNFGQALAYACRARGVRLVVYAATGANSLKVERMRALGGEVRLEGDDFDAAKDAARRHAEASGALMVEDGLQPEITEGAGSIAVELLARGPSFDTLLVPVGNGALINGIARWVKHAAPAIQVVGVCSAGAPAMAESWRLGPGGGIVSHASVSTIADGIAVRQPIPDAVEDMFGLVDDMVLVDDADVRTAMALLLRHAGLVVEPAGAAGLAALVAAGRAYAGRRVATVICGGNVTPEQLTAWLT